LGASVGRSVKINKGDAVVAGGIDGEAEKIFPLGEGDIKAIGFLMPFDGMLLGNTEFVRPAEVVGDNVDAGYIVKSIDGAIGDNDILIGVFVIVELKIPDGDLVVGFTVATGDCEDGFNDGNPENEGASTSDGSSVVPFVTDGLLVSSDNCEGYLEGILLAAVGTPLDDGNSLLEGTTEKEGISLMKGAELKYEGTAVGSSVVAEKFGAWLVDDGN
jgi:hypothetical protein